MNAEASNTVRITKAEANDAAALAELINSAYRGEGAKLGWTTEADLLDGTRTDPDLMSGIIGSPANIVLKYTEGDRLCGCVELRLEGKRLYLGMLTVRPDLQGKGIGKALMLASEKEARNHNCKSIFMTVISVRRELIDWYIRHGYVDTGLRKPFAFNDPRYGLPRQQLEFAVLEKQL